MILQALTGAAYSLVQSSWRAATLAVPVYLLTKSALMYRSGKLDSYQEEFLDDSRLFVGGLALIGLLSAVSGVEIPRFRLVGDIIAVMFFGFLFWKF